MGLTIVFLQVVFQPVAFKEKCYDKHIFISPVTKTYLYNFDPLKPHFHGFTGVYIIFLISAQNVNYVYSLEPPRRF